MVSSATTAQEVRRVIAAIILATTVLSSCNQSKRHSSVPQSARPVQTSKPKSYSGKQVIETPKPKLTKRPYRLEANSVQNSSPSSKPSISIPDPTPPEQAFPEPSEIAEIELPQPTRPAQSNEIEELPKIDKVKPLFQKPQQPALGSVGEVIVNANNATRIIDAQGRRVTVNGSDGLILITGGTEQLIVKGDSNQIQCDTATNLLVSGSKNNVVFDKFGGGEVSGNSNKVNWDAGLLSGFNPMVNNTGSNNTIGAN